MRMPLSKQRNKHIQRALVEAGKLAPRQSHELAVIYEREKQKGNGNRATLAVARKWLPICLPCIGNRKTLCRLKNAGLRQPEGCR
jgi:transposase